MKSTMLLAMLMLMAAAGPSNGQPSQGSVGVFFTANPSSAADSVWNGVVAFVPFRDIFVVSFDVPGGMEGYEFSLSCPRGMLISGGRILPQAATDTGLGDDNWIVRTGGVCLGKVGTFALVRYASPLFLASPGNDAPICLWASKPSSFSGGGPGYVRCDARGEMRSFLPAYKGCALINRTIRYWQAGSLDKQPMSFGALKAKF